MRDFRLPARRLRAWSCLRFAEARDETIGRRGANVLPALGSAKAGGTTNHRECRESRQRTSHCEGREPSAKCHWTLSGKAAEGAPSQETCPERRHSRVGSSLLPLETGGMRTVLFISFAVAGRLLAQENGPDTAMRDTGTTREAVLEGREVSAVGGDVPSGAIRLTRDDLSRSANLADALGREPGVQVRQSGGLGGFSTLSLRGSPSEQVEVLLDGIPLGGSAGSTVDVGPIPLDGLERAEILQAGSDGSGGTPRLELTSRKGWARLGGSTRVGSFGERAVSGWWGDAAGKASVSSWWETSRNDYPFPWDNGTKYNASDDAILRLSNNDYTGWGATGAWRPSEEWEGAVRLDGSERGLSSPLLVDPDGRWDREALQGDLRWTRAGDLRQTAEASWRRGWSRWKDHDRSSGYQASTASRETADDGNLSWSIARASGGWWDPRAAFALRWERSDRHSVGEQGVAETPDGSRVGGSTSLGWSGKDSDRWGADLSLRGDLVRDERDFSMALSGATGIADTVLWREAGRGQGRIWARQGWLSEWLAVSGRERLPDFSEWMGDNGAGLPKPSLRSEKSATVELGSKADFNRTSAQLSLWYADYRDPILATTAGTSPLIVHENGPGYEVAGADATASGNWKFLSGKVCGTVQKARIRNSNPSLDGNEPRRTPRWKGSAELAAVLPFGFHVGYTLDAQGSTWATELNSPDDHRPGRILHGTWLRWKQGPVCATFAVRNLADVHTEDIEDLPLSGRQYQARLELDFARAPNASRSNTPKERTNP